MVTDDTLSMAQAVNCSNNNILMYGKAVCSTSIYGTCNNSLVAGKRDVNKSLTVHGAVV